MGPCRTRGPRRPRTDPPGWSRPARHFDGQRDTCRAVRDVPILTGRPAQDRYPGAGPGQAHSHDSRAPLMARVSFEDVKRVGIALAWVVLYAAIGLGLTIWISNLVPGWGGGRWYVFRNGAYEVIGFVVATVVVGNLLNKY